MTLIDALKDAVMTLQDSLLYRGTLFTGTVLVFVVCILAILLGVTFLLRIFFKRHPVVNRAHKTLIYLLTMAGVLALLFAGFVFSMVPLIPGVLFVFIALLLMRRYHRWVWLDRKIALIARQIRRTTLGQRYYAWRKRIREERLRRKEERLRQKQIVIQEKLNKLREARRTREKTR